MHGVWFPRILLGRPNARLYYLFFSSDSSHIHPLLGSPSCIFPTVSSMDVNPGTFLRQPPSPHRPSDRDDDDVAVHVRQFAHSLAEGEAQIVTTRTQGTQSSTRHQSSSSSEPGSRLGPRARGQDIKTGIFVSDDSCGHCVHGSLVPPPRFNGQTRRRDSTPTPISVSSSPSPTPIDERPPAGRSSHRSLYALHAWHVSTPWRRP